MTDTSDPMGILKMTLEEQIQFMRDIDAKVKKSKPRSNKRSSQYPIKDYPWVVRIGSSRTARRYVNEAQGSSLAKFGIPSAPRDNQWRPVRLNTSDLMARFNTDLWKDDHREPSPEELEEFFPESFRSLSDDKAPKVGDTFVGTFFGEDAEVIS